MDSGRRRQSLFHPSRYSLTNSLLHSLLRETTQCTQSTITAPSRSPRPSTWPSSGDGKFLAGGMTLIPAMKTRLAAPSDVVDLSPYRRAERHQGHRARPSPSAPPRPMPTSPPTQRSSRFARRSAISPAISAIRMCATRAPSAARSPTTIRRRTIRRRCWRSTRRSSPTSARLRLAKFFTGLFETALKDGEIVTAVRFTAPAKAGYAKFPNPASRYAMTGVFVAKGKEACASRSPGQATTASSGPSRNRGRLWRRNSTPRRWTASPCRWNADGRLHASPEYRANLVVVMAKRAVAEANA